MSAAFRRVVSVCGRFGFFWFVFFLFSLSLSFFLELKTELRASVSVHARPLFMRLFPTLSGLFLFFFPSQAPVFQKDIICRLQNCEWQSSGPEPQLRSGALASM